MAATLLFFALVLAVVSVSIRIGGVLFSREIRDSVIRHPVAHALWLAVGMAAFLILFFTWFLPMTRLPSVAPRPISESQKP
jgi:hypothetical protein